MSFILIKSFSDNVMTPKFASHYTFSISLLARMSHWKSNSYWIHSHSSKIHFCSVVKHSGNWIITKMSQLSLYEQNWNVMVVNFSQIVILHGPFLSGCERRKKEPVSFGPHKRMNGNGNVQNGKKDYVLKWTIIIICSYIDCLW